jgi:carboxypeptidase C (cathepsin A)
MSVRWNRTNAPSSATALAAAMKGAPGLRVFHACGYFDMAIACHASDYAARNVAAALRPRVSSRVYAGGHATYTDDTARRLLRDDVVAFIRGGK